MTNSFANPPAHAVGCQCVRLMTKPCSNTVMSQGRIPVHISRREHRALDPGDVYELQASGGRLDRTDYSINSRSLSTQVLSM